MCITGISLVCVLQIINCSISITVSVISTIWLSMSSQKICFHLCQIISFVRADRSSSLFLSFLLSSASILSQRTKLSYLTLFLDFLTFFPFSPSQTFISLSLSLSLSFSLAYTLHPVHLVEKLRQLLFSSSFFLCRTLSFLTLQSSLFPWFLHRNPPNDSISPRSTEHDFSKIDAPIWRGIWRSARWRECRI